MLRRNYLTLTFITNEIFEDKNKREQFNVYYNSSIKNIPDCDHVYLTNNLKDEWKNCLLEDDSVDVVEFKHPIKHLFCDRHFAYWEYLIDHGHKYKEILISDCRDILFQKNPFEWVNEWKSRFEKIKGNHKFLNDFVIVTSEGFKMSRNGFSTIENFKFEQDISPNFRAKTKEQFVINGGVSLGTPLALKNYHFLIWSLMSKNTQDYTDQAAINWAFTFLKEDETYSISFPQQDTLCLTGEGVKEGVVSPSFQDGLIKNSLLDQSYFMVHQWDRMDQSYLKESISKYS